MIEIIYDTVNGDQYAPYASFAKKCFEKHSDIPVKEVLDLGCGTGGITALLADMGYDMVGVDISPEMLMCARENTYGKDVLLLNQDMRSFELYGTVQGIICSFDTLNYLSSEEELVKTLSLCRLYMEKGGVMVCDINSLYRYEKVYGDNSFVYEVDEDMLVWQNAWDSKTEKCAFYLTMFAEEEKEKWLLENLSELSGQGLIYCNDEATCKVLGKQLRKAKIMAEAYIDVTNPDKKERINYLTNSFSSGGLPVLVTTQDAGKNLSNPHIRFVVHYDVPDSQELYQLHVTQIGQLATDAVVHDLQIV